MRLHGSAMSALLLSLLLGLSGFSGFASLGRSALLRPVVRMGFEMVLAAGRQKKKRIGWAYFGITHLSQQMAVISRPSCLQR